MYMCMFTRKWPTVDQRATGLLMDLLSISYQISCFVCFRCPVQSLLFAHFELPLPCCLLLLLFVVVSFRTHLRFFSLV